MSRGGGSDFSYPFVNRLPHKQTDPRGYVQARLRGGQFIYAIVSLFAYIMPIPGFPPAGIGGIGSLISATTDSVVRNVEATDVAF